MSIETYKESHPLQSGLMSIRLLVYAIALVVRIVVLRAVTLIIEIEGSKRRSDEWINLHVDT